LDATQATRDVVRGMAAAMEENRRYLTKLDSEIGDGDHGNNMNRGFQAALERLEGTDASTPADVLKSVSMALISKVGGAAGPLYGTAFLRASSALGDKEEVSTEDAAEALEAALGGIKQRGKAEVGDKTIVDALEPAAKAAKEAKEAAGEGSVAAVFRSAADAAKKGAESTVPLTAKRGRASYLGARAAGHQDPGATSTYMLLDAAARALEGSS
jgi:phosphoenolpyruvate---glycerone phosphotransferase subunit DhaL